MDLEAVTAATFAPHRGSAFTVIGTDAALELRLAEVDVLPADPNGPRAEPFSLVFSGPRVPQLEQRTHQLEHAALGAIEIFLVPIGYGADGGLLYEAVFN